MRAAVFHGAGDITVDQVPEPKIERPTDAIVTVEAAAVCGSDLWTYRGQSTAAPGVRIGHEFVGTVSEIGSDVKNLTVGDWVIAPFRFSCGECFYCTTGLSSSCVKGGFWSREVVEGGQGELVRVPLADGTLVKASADGERPADELIPSMLALTDVMTTGYHASLSADVEPGSTVCVIGDGAVAVCAVIAAKLLGAARIIVLGSSHKVRQELMREVGADEVLSVRGDAAVQEVLALTEGRGPEAVMECVGTDQSFSTALAVAAPGATIGYVGFPHSVAIDPAKMFGKNIRLAGGISPARNHIDTLLPVVLDGTINPGKVFTNTFTLNQLSHAYRSLDERACVKPLITI